MFCGYTDIHPAEIIDINNDVLSESHHIIHFQNYNLHWFNKNIKQKNKLDKTQFDKSAPIIFYIFRLCGVICLLLFVLYKMNFKTTAALLDGVHTDFVVSTFE